MILEGSRPGPLTVIIGNDMVLEIFMAMVAISLVVTYQQNDTKINDATCIGHS